jgi:hypothetical protein
MSLDKPRPRNYKRAWNGGRDLTKDPWTVAEFNTHISVGREVILIEDDGSITRTRTRSAAWEVGPRGVVLVEGKTGGYDIDRIGPA